ncbi:MAG: replication initiation protein, partial [Fusobacteriaceae bacterium]
MKKNEIVRYHNDMNKYLLGSFKEKELDLLFAICYKLKEEKVRKVNIGFSELKNLVDFEDRNLKRFVSNIKSMFKKFSSILVEVGKDENNCVVFPLFNKYELSVENQVVSFSMHEDYQYLIFADFSLGHFTEFELKQFVSLKSGYSKNIFKLLKQWHNTGFFEIELVEFRRMLDIPKSYRISEITFKILNPVVSELSKYFLNLKLEKIKNGKNISKLKFTWTKGIEIIHEIEEVKPKKIEFEQTIIKTKVTQKQYDEFYQEHLIKIGAVDNKYIKLAFDTSHKNKFEIVPAVEKIKKKNDDDDVPPPAYDDCCLETQKNMDYLKEKKEITSKIISDFNQLTKDFRKFEAELIFTLSNSNIFIKTMLNIELEKSKNCFMKLAQSNQLIENGDFSEKHLKTFKINLIKIEEILQKKYDLLELSK